jgi:tetratricopeptide (TPR) repeat protein
VLARAATTVRELGSPTRCLDPVHLRARFGVKPDGLVNDGRAQRRAQEESVSALAKARTQHALGRSAEALETVRSVLDTATTPTSDSKTLPLDLAIHARLRGLEAEILLRLARYPEAEEATRATIELAERSDLAPLALRSWARLIFNLAVGQRRFDEARALEFPARSAAQRIEPPDTHGEFLLEHALASLYAVSGDPARAAEAYGEALLRNPGPEDRLKTTFNLALMEVKLGRNDAGLAHALEAVEGSIQLHGPHHPGTARYRLGAASVLVTLDRHDEAREQCEKGIALLEDSRTGPRWFDLALLRVQLGVILLAQGDPQTAIELSDLAGEDATRGGVASMIDGPAFTLRGSARCQLGRFVEGRGDLARAIEAGRDQAGRNADLFDALVAASRCAREAGDLGDARASLEAARANADLNERAVLHTYELAEQSMRIELSESQTTVETADALQRAAKATGRSVDLGIAELLLARAAVSRGADPSHHLSASRRWLLESRGPRARRALTELDLMTAPQGDL